jgi:hypothetical protein
MKFINFIALIIFRFGLTTFQTSKNSEATNKKLSTIGKTNIRDMVLIYDSKWTKRPVWNEDMLAPYLSLSRADGKHDWLFDGFLFIEFQDNNYQYGEGKSKPPAPKSAWKGLMDHYLEEGHSLTALNSAIEKIKTKAPAHGKHKVVITLPTPYPNQKDWGEIDGKVMDFSKDEDRIAACKWYVDYTIETFQKAGFQNLQLAGFYWVTESSLNGSDLLKTVSDYVHEKTLGLYWIPYYGAKGYNQWASYGFDEAWYQPNLFFHPELPGSHVDKVCQIAKQYGMSLEFECDASLLTDSIKVQKMNEYIDGFTRNNIFRDNNITYYEGGSGFYKMKNSPGIGAEMYKKIMDIIVERQKINNSK